MIPGGRDRMHDTSGRWAGILFSAAVLITASAGCGGGGDSVSPPPAATYTLAGTISAPAGVAVDSDVNDPNEPHAANDPIDTPQDIANPVSLGGYVNVPYAGPAGRSYAIGDRDDYFRVTLNSGDRIFLSVGDADADLDLYLYNQGGGDPIAASKGTGATESLAAPGSGTYIVNVYAYSGASNYVLAIGADAGPADHDTLTTEQDFMPGQAVVRFADAVRGAAVGRSLAGRAADLGMDLVAGGSGRAVLLNFGQDYQRSDAARALGIAEERSVRRAAAAALQRKLDTLDIIKVLRRRSDVISADPNYVLHPYATPDDPYYSLQWHYPLINLPQAWDQTTGGGGVIVAVVDTGVLLGHPDLAGRLTDDGYDFISDASVSNDGDGIDADPDDPGDGATPGASSFHGTHCAGIVAAATNNGIGLAGVSWGAKVMPIRVLGKGGGTLYDILQGVRYAAGLPNDSGIVRTKPADIISMSLGGGGYSSAAQALFTRVSDAGVILVAAAGNEATSIPSYPASYDGVISVSAVNINSTLASYSNYGSGIDVAAPGGDSGDLDGDGYQDLVWSTCGDDSTGTIRYVYSLKAGTSMATPHVAGVMALMKAVRPELTADDLDGWLRNGDLTNDIGVPGRDNLYGYGLIDAYKAVLRAQDDTAVTVLKVDPSALNFGLGGTSATLTASKIGSGSLSVISVGDNADWLSVAAESVDADGLGTYTVMANRTGLAAGTYTAAITFTTSPAGAGAVPVNLQVAASAAAPDAGVHYVLLVDADTYEIARQDDVLAVDGRYSYSFADVSQGGRYLIYAGSDRDNDMYIDNAGEFIGAYRSLDQITIVAADDNRTDLNFATDLRLLLMNAGRLDTGGGVASARLRRIR